MNAILRSSDKGPLSSDLMSYQAPFLHEKLIHEGVFQTEAECEEAFQELKKYFVLLHTYGTHVAMCGESVDKVWHQFILFTKEYHSFCRRFFGGYIHHLPATSFSPMPPGSQDEFLQAYRSSFGELPSVWGLTSWPAKKALDLDSQLKEGAASCQGGGCGKCGGGNGCRGCKGCHSEKKAEVVVQLEASCSKCNGCGHCSGCHGCRGE